MEDGESYSIIFLTFWGFDSSPPDTPQQEHNPVYTENQFYLLEKGRQERLKINDRATRGSILACSVFLCIKGGLRS